MHPPITACRTGIRFAGLALLVAAFCLQPLQAQNPAAAPEVDEALPKLAEMALPTAKELLTGKPLDWIVLKRNDEVIVCESVTPRPDTLAKMELAIQAMRAKRPRAPSELKKHLEEFDKLFYVTVVFPDAGDEPEYRLHRDHIKEIIHHEDLMLRRAQALMDVGALQEAFEILFVLDRSRADWPGFEAARRRQLFLEADQTWKQGRPEAAVAILEELHQRDGAYSGLKQKLGEIVDGLVSAAAAGEDFRQARFFLRRLETVDRQNPVAVKWRNDLLQRTQQLMQQAGDAEGTRDFSLAVVQAQAATRILPRAPGVSELYNRVLRRYPRLSVGTVGPLPASPPWLLPSALRRRQFLTQSQLFHVTGVADAPRYASAFVEDWEPADLGRKVRVRLRQVRQPWESRPVLTASQFVSLITQRMYPQAPSYNGRLQHAIHSYSVKSPFEAEIQFHRQPLRSQALFAFPLGNETFQSDVELTSASPLLAFGASPLDGRFLTVESSPGQTVLRRTILEPDASAPFHVSEVVETSYPSHDEAMRAFLRGDVWLLPELQPWDLAKLQQSKEFVLRQYSLPVTHVLQFHPQNVWLRDREMRRALLAALDVERILADVVLRDETLQHGRLTTAPYPRQIVSLDNRTIDFFGYSKSEKIRQPVQDLTLAIALSLAVKKRQKSDLPEFRLLVEPDSTLSRVADELIRQWKRSGLTVKRVVLDDLETEQLHARDTAGWDIVLRTAQMADPVCELWPLLTLDSSARMEGLAMLPDWLRQELLELETARDWSSAVAQLKLLQERLAAEVQLIPLWEVDQFLLARKQIVGMPTPPLNTYDEIETWTLQPWYPTDLP